MDINEIVGLIPEDKRETVKAELGQFVKLDGRDAADKLIRDNPNFKSFIDSYISKNVAAHDERFMAEKLPSLVESEIAKRNPPKDPRDAKIAELENKYKEMERMSLVEKQTALAVAVAAEKGIPTDLAKRYIGNNDEETIANLTSLSAPLMAWRDEAVKKEIAARLGNNGTPSRGSNPDQKKAMEAEYTRLMNERRFPEAQRVKDRLKKME